MFSRGLLDSKAPLDSLGEGMLTSLSNLGKHRPMTNSADILPGTLDLLILKAVSLGSLHGFGVMLRIQQISRGAFEVEQGALYPALYRLEEKDMLASEWGVSENNRRAKYYRLTRKGEKHLREKTDTWNRLASAIATVLNAHPEEV